MSKKLRQRKSLITIQYQNTFKNAILFKIVEIFDTFLEHCKKYQQFNTIKAKNFNQKAINIIKKTTLSSLLLSYLSLLSPFFFNMNYSKKRLLLLSNENL